MRSFSVVGFASLLSSVVCACSTHSSSVSSLPGMTDGPGPYIRQSGQGHWLQFPQSGGQIGSLVVGPDKNIWFTIYNNFTLNSMTMTGVETTYSIPLGTVPGAMISGPHSDLWFLDGSYIGRATTSGVINEYLNPIPNEQMYSLTLGPDRNVWFSEDQGGGQQAMIGRITSDGRFLQPFNISGGFGMVKGPDGRVWVAQYYNPHFIVAITVTGQATEYGGLKEYAEHIVVGPDGNLWFNENDYIGKITTSGTITEYSEPVSLGITNLTVGPDKHIWFSTYNTYYIGRISLSGVNQYFQNPGQEEEFQIVTGPDKNIWWAGGAMLGVYVRLVLTVQPSSIAFTGNGQMQTITVSETKYTGGWTATSLNPAVATVAPASSNTFTVTSVGSGSTSIDVADSKGNDFLVSVTVP